MFKFIDFSSNKFNEFQCRISNFDDILFTPMPYKICPIFYTPGKVMHQLAEVIQLLEYQLKKMVFNNGFISHANWIECISKDIFLSSVPWRIQGSIQLLVKSCHDFLCLCQFCATLKTARTSWIGRLASMAYESSSLMNGVSRKLPPTFLKSPQNKVKFVYFEKATKIWNNLPFFLTFLSNEL